MNGIAYQFANSPINKEINTISIGTSGTVSALATGSADLMWRATTNGGNAGEIRITTKEGTTDCFILEAGVDTGWIPGNLENYWYYGQVAGDTLHLWRLR